MKRLVALLISFVTFSVYAKGGNTISFGDEDTVYDISIDYDLSGKTITIPKGCTLKFNGGVIKNGCLKGNGTLIETSPQQIFSEDIHFGGSWGFDAWLPEWFGAKGKSGQIDTRAIQCALDAARDTELKMVKLQGKTYYTDATLNIYPYTSLIGSDQSASWLYATQIMPIKKVDAIQLTAAEKEGKSTGVTLKNLIIRNGSGESYTMSGVLMSKDGDNFGVARLRIDNVQVLYFEYGIKADLYGGSSFAYCDFRNVECKHNNIGFYVDGHFKGGKDDNKVWMNVNRFEFCRFSDNRIGGVYIHNVWMLLNNVFDQCTIEGNGNEYSFALYNQYGVFGAKFANRYTPTSGGNTFQNCYFEGNYPRRNGFDVDINEYKYEGIIYPKSFIDNKKIGNVVLQQHNVNFTNCISLRNKNFVLLNDNSHINITGTTVYDLGKVSTTDSICFFIEFNDAYVQSSVNTEKNRFNISKNNSLQYFHFIATPEGVDSKYSIHKEDDFDGGEVHLEDMSVKGLLTK